MASMMHTCEGFVGLKWAHKQQIHMFLTFLKFQGGPKVTKVPHFLAAWGSKKWLFWCKMLWPAFQKCASHCSEKHIFTKSCEHFVKQLQKSPRKPQMASMMHTCVGFVGLMWAHKQQIHIFARFFQIPGSPEYSVRTNSPAARGVWEGVGGG